ncbi:transposase, partial [Saccharicrinis fermentans]
DYLVYPKNIGYSLLIDETALSNGELYTILTNKAKRGKKGSIVGIFKGTHAADIIKLIKENFTDEQRRIVKEVTLDMANSMSQIVKKCFSKATRIIDRFHVQNIINFFDNRSTNAAAESFNAKVKDFRRQFRGVVDVKFFLFRLTKIFA